MSIYLKFGGIAGAVTTKGFNKWIECSTFQWGVSRAIGTAARGSLNREASEPSISEVVLTKNYDIASIKMIEDVWGGNLNTKAEIKFTTTVKDGVDTYLAYELENCGISSYSISGHDQGNPLESFSLNFTKITINHTGKDEKGGGSPVRAAYDLTKMAKA